MDDKNMENGMTNGSQDDNKNNDNYEKICYMCRRPESKAGPMISMPGGMCLCHDCMQKAFDTVTKGGMDFSKMPNMPYMNMNFSDLSQMPPVNEIPQSQKLKKKKEPEKQLTMKDIPAPHVIKGKLDEYVIGQEKGVDIVSAVIDRIVDKDNRCFDMQTFNMFPKLLTFITGNNNDPGQVMLF